MPYRFPLPEGTIRFNGGLLQPPYRGEARRRIQILFQHPEVAFNPRMTLLESLREPYRFFKIPFSRPRLCAYLERFGIYEEHLDRYPEALSGGELQRLALARVMLLRKYLPSGKNVPILEKFKILPILCGTIINTKGRFRLKFRLKEAGGFA